MSPELFTTGYADAWAGRPERSNHRSYLQGYGEGLQDRLQRDTLETPRKFSDGKGSSGERFGR